VDSYQVEPGFVRGERSQRLRGRRVEAGQLEIRVGDVLNPVGYLVFGRLLPAGSPGKDVP
jgi:hypothetical protein